MAFTTKQPLIDAKFWQPANGTLGLSGSTHVGVAEYLTGMSANYNAKSLASVKFVTGQTANVQADIDYISGVTDNIILDITYISGVTSANTADIEALGAISGLTNASITGVTNGLIKVGSHSAKLGGLLTEATVFTGSSVNHLKYQGDYSSGYGLQSIPDYQSIVTMKSTGKTSDFTLSLPMLGEAIIVTNSVETFVTIPLNSSVAFPIGSMITLQQGGAGVVTATGETVGVTITGVALSTTQQYGFVQYWKTGTDTWSVVGGAIELWEAVGNVLSPVNTNQKVPVIYISGLTGALGAFTTGSTNGLTTTAQVVSLGGALTKPTLFTGTTANHLKYAGNYSAGFTIYSLIDKNYVCLVSGQTLTCANTYAASCASSCAAAAASAACSYADSQDAIVSGATLSCANDYTDTCVSNCTITASNGLCCTANNITLGGALTQTTALSGSQVFGINATTLNLTGATTNLGGALTFTTMVGCTPKLLCVNTTTGAVGVTSLSEFGGITGGTNGIVSCGNQNLGLGGHLCTDTVINGCKLTLGDLKGACISTSGTTDMVLNAKSNGAIYLKAQSGVVNTDADYTNAVGIIIDYNANCAIMICNGTASPKGMVYADDYSTTYSIRSLVDKGYVDSIATGLQVHDAAFLTTTTNIPLSGLTVIDGVATTAGMRVLVKDQTLGYQNGLYSASTTTWTRTTDFNFDPPGEITNGDLIPITSGSSENNTIWVLTTPNPIATGDTLTFTKFSTVIDLIGGDGISVVQSGGQHTVSIDLATNSGLNTTSGLAVDSSIAGTALSLTTGVLNVNAANCGAVGAIPVGYNAGDCLVVACSDITTALGTPINGANNGLCKVGSVVKLGGVITGATTLTLASDACSLTFTDTAATKRGVVYGGDYSTSFGANSLVSAKYVTGLTSGLNTRVTTIEGQYVTGATNGLSKSGSHLVQLGGTLCKNTNVSLSTFTLKLTGGTGNGLCVNDGNTTMCQNSAVASGNTRVTSTPTGIAIRACKNGTNCLSYSDINPVNTYFTTCDGGSACGSIGTTMGTACIAGTSCVTITSPSVQLATDLPAGSTSDTVVVRDATGELQGLAVSAITGTLSIPITGATNGLGVISKKVCLGGTLLNNTNIGGSFRLSLTGATTLSTHTGYQISGTTILKTPATVQSLFFGAGAGNTTNTGGCNVAFGCLALSTVANGYNNFAAGHRALQLATSGYNNVAIGCYAMLSGGSSNSVAIGACSQSKIQAGAHNISLGELSLYGNLNGNWNIAIGACSNRCGTTTNLENISIGKGSMEKNTNGRCNIVIGSNVLCANTTGCENIVLGHNAATGNTSGSFNVAIGRMAGANNLTGARNVFIGDYAGKLETGSDKLHIANTAACSLISGDFASKTVTLDAKLTLSQVPTAGSIADAVLVREAGGEVRTVVGSSLGDKNNIYSKTIVIVNATGTTASTYVQLISGATIFTLPAAPSDGQAFKIKDASLAGALTNNITIARNGNLIDGVANDATINTDGGALELMYDAIRGWSILSFVN